MAQTARLNLRMQKELKLLLTDPPPGAFFPHLTGDSDICSPLSSIEAQIEGPEGTAYAKGIFNIKIQIPERYPFQPPSVTFATPIYHPNIDTGGRICLDILNLPPKGAWQPSLNISTVLTSIGLLLSEPNPDDGLMCEVSREYKYDRQAFDQKAQSMTEKYAKAGASENSSCCSSSNHVTQTNSNPPMMEDEGMDVVLKHEVHEDLVSHSKLSGICQKLSWESDSIQKGDVDRVENDIPSQCLENQMESKRPKKEPKGTVHDYNPGHGRLYVSKRKLSLESVSQTKKRDGGDKENVVPSHNPSPLNSQSSSMASESLSIPLTSSHYEQQPQQATGSKLMNDGLSTTSEKLRKIGRKLSLESSKVGNVDDSNHKKISGSSQLLSSLDESNVSQKALPMLQDVYNSGLQLNKDCINGTENEFNDTKQKKQCSAGNKLSLGLFGSSKTRERDNEENGTPTYKIPLSESEGSYVDSSKPSLMPQAGESYDWRSRKYGTSASSKKSGIARKAPEPLGQCQGSNDCNRQLPLHSQKLSNAPPKSLSMPQVYTCAEKQKSDQDQVAEVPGIEESPMPDTIIVLDSEDSDEEWNVSQRTRLPLACKRLAGKWRRKA